MARQTNEDRIVALLRSHPGLDDDEISHSAGIRPRQTVNQICRRLESRGALMRTVGPRGKIVNALIDAPSRQAPGAAPRPVRRSVPRSARIVRPSNAPGATPRHVGRSDNGVKFAPPADDETWNETRDTPVRGDLTDTLLIVPCSKSKKELAGRRQASGPRIGDCLPMSLAERLDRARAANRQRADVDERTLAPAWQRYGGRFYQAAGAALSEAVGRHLHLLILSGGYGVLPAREPIGLYEAKLKTGGWPGHVLESVLAGYARRHRLKRMRAFVAGSTDYRKVVERTDWKGAGVDDAILLMPESGSQHSVPVTLGEAFAALIRGATLDRSWRSSAGLSLIYRKLV